MYVCMYVYIYIYIYTPSVFIRSCASWSPAAAGARARTEQIIYIIIEIQRYIEIYRDIYRDI